VSALGKLRARARRRLEARRERRLAATRLVRAFARSYPEAFVIEIGANDGVEHDPIRDQLAAGGWRALMVEPAASAFARLRRNYAGAAPRVALVNAAVADHDGEVELHELEWVEDGGGRRLDVFGSLSEHAVRTSAEIFVPTEHRRIVRTTVPCLTLRSLCRRHRVERIDLLVIDVEGYDFEVVKQVDFTELRPRLLAYEHLLLSPADREACEALVRDHGYETLAERRDTWCLDTTIADPLTDFWRRLRPAVGADSIYSEPTAEERR